MTSRVKGERGFTLTEVLVALTLSSLILGAAVTAFTSYLTQTATADKAADAQDAARNALDHMSIQLRSATSNPTTGNQPIEAFSAYNLVWLAPYQNATTTNNPLGLRHIRYCLDSRNANNELLWLQTAPFTTTSNRNWPTTSSCPSGAWPTASVVADHLVNVVQNTPMFVTPTDAQGNVTDANVNALVDVDTGGAPPATSVRTSVTLRNLNRVPMAVISCAAGLTGHALCDASGSTDSDNQTLKFAWKVDGATVGETSYKLDQASLASGSNHTFAVTVTDSGGLSASASQSLRMP
ncbi:MAG TPA: prepilin-type N-terminal cleavage/methylation domain-containing protein [Thermoleophilaceae bacterium]|nr:prepilin-type N-terminal cleavage/methylation domain-containing protein [Thermoleophilaceae bacterium]